MAARTSFQRVFVILLTSLYLWPDSSTACPIENELDRYLPASILESKSTLIKADLTILKQNNKNNPYVVKHRHFNDFLFKLFTDDHTRIDQEFHLVTRIQGAQLINSIIRKHGYQRFFKVPRKWLYMHPINLRHILVVEDMKILNSNLNISMWKSKNVSKSLLRALFTVVKEGGLYDSLYIKNIPFCEDHKIAFVDTERFNQQEIPYHNLIPSLSRKNKKYWKSLVYKHAKN